MREITSDLVRGFCPPRDDEGHKGTYGTALVIAGSRFMTGAQTLCAGAALRSGAGLVRVFSEEEALTATRINLPCALTSAYGEDPADNLRLAGKLIHKADSVAIGPGLDTEDKRNRDLLEISISSATRLVIDASALTILSKNAFFLEKELSSRREKGLSRAVLTPHIGEFKRLAGKDPEDILAECADYSVRTESVIILKSRKTHVFTPDEECYTLDAGNSGLSKGGSGDVLTGLIAGFLAQGMDEVKASVSAVKIHSDCGLLAREKYGRRAMLPSDLTEFLTKSYEMAGWT